MSDNIFMASMSQGAFTYEGPTRSHMARNFQRALGRVVPDHPTIEAVDEHLRVAHARMVLEEALELIAALGCIVTDPEGQVLNQDFTEVESLPSPSIDLVQVAHEGIDVQYITETTLAMYGLPVEPLWSEIHNSNMSKILPGGKLLRHQGTDPHEQYIKPDVRGIIDRARLHRSAPAESTQA